MQSAISDEGCARFRKCGRKGCRSKLHASVIKGAVFSQSMEGIVLYDAWRDIHVHRCIVSARARAPRDAAPLMTGYRPGIMHGADFGASLIN